MATDIIIRKYYEQYDLQGLPPRAAKALSPVADEISLAKCQMTSASSCLKPRVSAHILLPEKLTNRKVLAQVGKMIGSGAGG